MIKRATLSEDGHFRYDLVRYWGTTAYGARMLHVVMLNPSTADAEADDPTITRLKRRGMAEGYDGIVVNNLYAYRTPYPAALLARWAACRPIIGPDNDTRIAEAAAGSAATLVAWGSHVLAHKRDQAVLALLYAAQRPVLCLGLTADGFPRHPLHVAYKQTMFEYKGRFSVYNKT